MSLYLFDQTVYKASSTTRIGRPIVHKMEQSKHRQDGGDGAALGTR